MVAGCMSLCTAFAGTLSIALPVVQTRPVESSPFNAPFAPSQTYPPLNPPPIR